MKALTWQWESHGLFDYESSSIKKRELKLDKSCTIIRTTDTVDTIENESDPLEMDENINPLFNLVEVNSKSALQ